jgi:small subunit ribosomal protein S4e
MSHQKRQKVPKSWPIHRKGNTFVVSARSNPNQGVPLLVILRDILKIAQNRKEVKRALHENNVLLNAKIAKDERNVAVLFDTVTIVPSKKNYRISLSEKGKFIVEEIKETEANSKITKVADKKMLKGKKIQLNLSDGRNFLSDMKCAINDSVVVNFKDKKIEKCLALKEKANIIVFAGKHKGKKGILEKLETEKKMAKISAEGQEINVLIEQLMVI